MKKRFIPCLALVALLCASPPSSPLAAQPAARPQQAPQTYVNSIGMEFVRIPAGSFTKKQSTFIVSNAFYLGKYLVTQEQWTAVMGNNPSSFKDKTHPVETVSWDDAQDFIKRLNAKEKHRRYRLPTEAEWELALRGGVETPYFFLKDPQDWANAADALDAYAWFKKNACEATHPVGQKKPNPYGLHDMYGNAWEWVRDGYGELPTVPEIKDYCGQAEDSLRVLRGGCWMCTPEVIRAGNRLHAPADRRNNHIGFRVALSPE